MSGYSTDDTYYQSELERRRERNVVKFIPWSSEIEKQANAGSAQRLDCKYCHIVLKPSTKTQGRLWCSGCGNDYNAQGLDDEDVKNSRKKAKRLKQRTQSTGPAPLIITSQPMKRRTKKPGSVSDIDEETRADLRLLGMIDDSNIQEG